MDAPRPPIPVLALQSPSPEARGRVKFLWFCAFGQWSPSPRRAYSVFSAGNTKRPGNGPLVVFTASTARMNSRHRVGKKLRAQDAAARVIGARHADELRAGEMHQRGSLPAPGRPVALADWPRPPGRAPPPTAAESAGRRAAASAANCRCLRVWNSMLRRTEVTRGICLGDQAGGPGLPEQLHGLAPGHAPRLPSGTPVLSMSVRLFTASRHGAGRGDGHAAAGGIAGQVKGYPPPAPRARPRMASA